MKKAKKESTVRVREIVSKLYDAEGNELLSLKAVQKVLQEKACINQYAYIIHDKDAYEEDTETHKAGDLKTPHIHLLMKFSQPQHTPYIPKWFGLNENFSQKVHNWDAALRYLIHLDNPEKYQYSPNEVKANFNYEAVLEEIQAEKNLDAVLDKILNGEIREYEKTKKINKKLLIRYEKKIKEAFRVRQADLEADAAPHKRECIFITGPSQSGKTTLAKKIADFKGLPYFVSSASNDPLYAYKDQPAVILDELRPDWMDFSDLLKLLDNHTTSTAKARYHNVFLQCDLIIITSICNIDDFCRRALNGSNEPAVQFKRRCGTYISMNPEDIFISRWDATVMRYTDPIKYRNDLLAKYIPQKRLEREDVEKHIAELMPFLQKENSTSCEDGFVEYTNEVIPFDSE